ncbi:MAG: N-acetylmuramoyl-L-alanine amidase, partial [Thermoanaerobacter sp.]|nr:N-acetylmuramoyl-L-alanine amidase [Thermoanaerobacter sp.]
MTILIEEFIIVIELTPAIAVNGIERRKLMMKNKILKIAVVYL